MDRNTEALVAAILTIAKFLPNVTYASETVATEFQQMLGRYARSDPVRTAPRCRRTGRRRGDWTNSSTPLRWMSFIGLKS